jgi:hypothetical protein
LVKLDPAGEGRKQLGAQSVAAISIADLELSRTGSEVGITSLARLSNDELGIAVAVGAKAIGLPESNGMAL